MAQINKSQDHPKDFTRRLLVCTDGKGKAVNRVTLATALKKYGLNFNSLRYAHATKLIENEAIPKDTASRLGHTDATITQNLYTHDMEEMQRSTVEIFEKIIL